MSEPVVIALSIFGVFLLIYTPVTLFVLHQARQYAFLGDKTKVAISIFLTIVVFLLILGSIILIFKDWTSYPTL